MCVEGFHTDRFLLLRTPFCIEILIIELNLNGYCLNCSESHSSGPGRTNLYGHQYYQN
jgi:hypothetical protein